MSIRVRHGVALTTLATLTVLAVPGTSHAAAKANIRCAVQEPNSRGNHDYDLLIGSNYPRYTGKPFSFRVTYETWTRSHVVRTYVGTPRSFRVHIPGSILGVSGWYAGTRCTDWKYRLLGTKD